MVDVASPSDLGPIVSSGHLASGALPALSEFEFGMILAGHAFERWMVRCMAAAGVPNLSAMDVLVIHNVNHRAKAKRLADIAMVLAVEDIHVINYAVKKLERLGLVKTRVSARRGRRDHAGRRRAVHEVPRNPREAAGRAGVKGARHRRRPLSEIAAMMRALSGNYDQPRAPRRACVGGRPP